MLGGMKAGQTIEAFCGPEFLSWSNPQQQAMEVLEERYANAKLRPEFRCPANGLGILLSPQYLIDLGVHLLSRMLC